MLRWLLGALVLGVTVTVALAQSPPAIDTSGWKTFRDATLGFEVTHPVTWGVGRTTGTLESIFTGRAGAGREGDAPLQFFVQRDINPSGLSIEHGMRPAETAESLGASTVDAHRARRTPRHPPGDDRRLRKALRLLHDAQQERHLPDLDHPGFARERSIERLKASSPPCDSSSDTRRAFLGLILVFPCPWYMIAVGGLLPLPVIASFARPAASSWCSRSSTSSSTRGLLRVSRWVSSFVRIARIPRPVAGVLLLAALLALSFLRSTAAVRTWLAGQPQIHRYEVYRDAFAHWPRTKGLQA